MSRAVRITVNADTKTNSMSTKNKVPSAKSAEQCESAKAPIHKNGGIARADLTAALDALFGDENSGWEIPDSAVEGKLTRKVAQLEARIGCLTTSLIELQAEVTALKTGGKAPQKPGVRVDAMQAAAAGK